MTVQVQVNSGYIIVLFYYRVLIVAVNREGGRSNTKTGNNDFYGCCMYTKYNIQFVQKLFKKNQQNQKSKLLKFKRLINVLIQKNV